jgi:hypothetical protein
MRNRRSTVSTVTIFLLLLCMALGGVIYAEIAAGHGPAEFAAMNRSPRPVDTAPPATSRASLIIAPLDSYAEMVARPIFSPARRPPRVAMGDAPVTSVEGLVLKGIVVSRDARFAIVLFGSPPKPVRIVEGQELQGWTVHAITADGIVLRNGEGTRQLRVQDRASDPIAKKPDANRTVPARQ